MRSLQQQPARGASGPLPTGRAAADRGEGTVIAPKAGRDFSAIPASAPLLLQRQIDDAAPAAADPGEDQDETMPVQDGDAPLNATETVGDQPLAEAAGDEKQTGGNEPRLLLQRKTNRTLTAPPRTATRAITSISIDLTRQRLTINWSSGRPTRDITISSGRGCPNTPNPCSSGNNAYCTPNVTGRRIYGLGDATFTNRAGDAMSWYVGFDSTRGIGIHDAQRVTGSPASHGCVRIDDAHAHLIHNHVTSATIINVTGTAPAARWRRRSLAGYPECPASATPRPAHPRASRPAHAHSGGHLHGR